MCLRVYVTVGIKFLLVTPSLVSEGCTIGPDLAFDFTNKALLRKKKNSSFPLDVSARDVHF